MGRKLLVAVLFSTFTGILAVGCGEAEELADCQAICEKKQECVDGEYDVSACRSDCESKSDSDEDYRQEANECEACLDGKSCTEAISCLDNCPLAD